MTPRLALAEAQRLYEERKPVGWRTFTMGGIRVDNRVRWYEMQVRRSYPNGSFEEAEAAFYGDLVTVLNYVNDGRDPNLVGDLRMTFRRLCRMATKVARRIQEEDPADLARRMALFGFQ